MTLSVLQGRSPAGADADARFALVLFENEPAGARAAMRAGVDGLIVDLERDGKHRRQEGADTEINEHRLEDLDVLRDVGVPLRFCRIEGPGRWRPADVEEVIARGATHILLPMVRDVDEVKLLLDQVAGRVAVSVLIETEAAVRQSEMLARLPLCGAFVGLNDLAIDRRTENLFAPLADGTVERVATAFEGRELGFGGVTLVDRGAPVPAQLLLAEMARLGATFGFLRRSFRRDIVGRNVALELARIHSTFAALRQRDAAAIDADRRELLQRIAELA